MEEDYWKVDSADELERERGKCMAKDCHVRKVFKELQDCENRVRNKPYTAETCQQELKDLCEALDHCIGTKVFDALK